MRYSASGERSQEETMTQRQRERSSMLVSKAGTTVIHTCRWLALGALVTAGTARAQDEVRNFKKPILMVETGGPHAPVRSLIWQDPATLLSGGLDKVVRVWDLEEGPHLSRTLRPMAWRGPDGIIYAMALAPKADASGQRLLAVAGYGVEVRRADFTIFRMPGIERISTGDIAARVLPPRTDDPKEPGHRNTIFCLAFDPTGLVLASGSADANANAILWDIIPGDRLQVRPRATLTGHTRDIRTLAFSPDGKRLATAGGDGSLRLWDVAQGTQLDARLGHPQSPDPINSLAFSPDGRSIVVGREVGTARGGKLYRFDAGNLAKVAPLELASSGEQGPVECVAYHPDGRQLAVSIKSDRSAAVDAMTIGTDLEIRAMPEGRVTHRRRVPGLVYTCAFSPSGDRLAYSGGTSQSIFIQEMSDLAKAPEELKGQGSTPFDLGFKADESQVLGFTRAPIDPANPPQDYDGFDLAQRKSRSVPANQLRHAIKEYQGWTLRGNVGQYILEAVHVDGRRSRLVLDPGSERLWWSSTLVPPGPGHARATVAIGCESGVVIFDLETGRRTRFFAGHSSPVVSLAPSPDGRWLASSSIDQSIMLYSLSGCDTLPGLGARFKQQPDGLWVIDAVEARSFAEAMGLRARDLVVGAEIDRRGAPRQDYVDSAEIGVFVSRVDGLAPNLDLTGILVARSVVVPLPGVFGLQLAAFETMQMLPSSKRNNPSLTLMLGVDKEWVLWTPQGYYDTSIEGDSRLLGWHINPPFDSALPTDFVPIGTYAKTMNRPELLQQVWTTGSLDQAMAAVAASAPKPENQAYDDQPPKIMVSSAQKELKPQPAGKVWVVNMPDPTLLLDLLAEGKRKIRELRLVLDERLLPVRKLGLVEDHHEKVTVNLPPNRRVRLEVQASNDQESQRSETIDLLYVPPPPPVEVKPSPAPLPPKPSVVVLSMGNEKFEARELGPIRFAEKDASSLADFLGKHLLPASGAAPLEELNVEGHALTGKQAAAASIEKALGELQEMPRAGRLRKGDLVVLVINSHVLEWEGTPAIVTADTKLSATPGPVLSGRDLSERLGELADYGCRVVVFLDGVHNVAEGSFKSDVKAWVRDLQRNRRVITFVASKEGPSGASIRDQHGYFALGLLHAFSASGTSAVRKDRTAPYSLDLFRKAVAQEVLDVSNRRQEVGCYIPPAVSAASLFARP